MGVTFVDVDWHGVTAREADLTGADLRGADLREADLTDATLRGVRVDLAGAISLAEHLGAVVDLEVD